MGNCCDSHKAAPCRPRNGCHSFEWRGIWKLGAYYFNDDYVTDFISYKNTILACRRNHMSDVNTEPELIYDDGVPVNVSPPNWSFVLYAGSGGDLSNLTFRLNNNILSYSIDGGSTFTEIGEFNFTESDPIYSSSVAASITTQDINNWNSKTSNIGTVTAVKVNGNISTPNESGLVDLGVIEGGGATVGTLNTNNASAQAPSSSESFSGTISLHKIAKTGNYNDLLNQPTIPEAITESTVSGWGFTKNVGTVTAVKVNNTTYNPTSGVVDLGTIGGGGASQLNDLSDVTLSSPATGQVLSYDGSKWVNGVLGTMNYEKLTSAQYASRQSAGTLSSSVLYIIVD